MGVPKPRVSPPPAWFPKAFCRGQTETMFPHDSAGVAVARRVCVNCAYQKECLEYALAERIPFGVWGGKSERERAQMSKRWAYNRGQRDRRAS